MDQGICDERHGHGVGDGLFTASSPEKLSAAAKVIHGDREGQATAIAHQPQRRIRHGTFAVTAGGRSSSFKKPLGAVSHEDSCLRAVALRGDKTLSLDMLGFARCLEINHAVGGNRGFVTLTGGQKRADPC